jgi:hypothetical protein
MNKKSKQIQIDKALIDNIREIITNSRTNIIQKVNHALIATYWEIGNEIVTNEKRNKFDKQSSRQIILSLSKQLTDELGKDFQDQTYSICGNSILNIKVSKHCLDNLAGLIYVNS